MKKTKEPSMSRGGVAPLATMLMEHISLAFTKESYLNMT